jgi:hypothetical protein
MKKYLIVLATSAAAAFGVARILVACAAIEKADPAAVYPTASGYCALMCKNGCCPFGGADDGWICPDPLDTTTAICFFNQPVAPLDLKLPDASPDAK